MALEKKLTLSLGSRNESSQGLKLLLHLLEKYQNWQLLEELSQSRPKLASRFPDLLLDAPCPESSKRLLELYLREELPAQYRVRSMRRFYNSAMVLVPRISKELRGRRQAKRRARTLAISLLLGMDDKAKKEALPALVFAIGDRDIKIAHTALEISKSFGPLPASAASPLTGLISREQFGWSGRELYRNLGPHAIPAFIAKAKKKSSEVDIPGEAIRALVNYGEDARSAIPFLDQMSASCPNKRLARMAKDAAKKLRSISKKN